MNSEYQTPPSRPSAMAAVRSKAVVLLLIHCWLLVPLWDSVIVLRFVVRYVLSVQVFAADIFILRCLSKKKNTWHSSPYVTITIPIC